MAAHSLLRNVKASILLSSCKRKQLFTKSSASACSIYNVLQRNIHVKPSNSLYNSQQDETPVILCRKAMHMCVNSLVMGAPKMMMHSLRCGSISPFANQPCLLHVRNKSRNMKGGIPARDSKKNQEDASSNSDDDDDADSSDDDDDDDDDEESSAFNKDFPEDESFPNTYKEVKRNLKSLRVDAVVSNGLNIARNKVDDYFLGSKLMLNGENVLKKAAHVSQGDYIDLISDRAEDGRVRVKRIRVVNIADEKTTNGNFTVALRTWKSNVTLED